MNTQADLDLLKNAPSVHDIDRIATAYLYQSHTIQLKVQYIITFLQHIIPIYQSLQPALKLKIKALFHSTIAISNILNQFKLTKNEIFLLFIKDLLHDPLLLVSVVDSTNDRTEQNLIKSLFFGSRLYNTFQGKIELDLYLNLMAKQLVELSKQQRQSPEFFISFLSLHPIESKSILFNEFLTTNNFPLLKSTVLKMTLFQKKQFIGKHLLPYLSTIIHVNNQYIASKILHQLNVTDIQDSIVDTISRIDRYELQNSISLIITNPREHINRLLGLWGLEQYVKDTPIESQELLTRELLILLNYIEPSEKLEISKTRGFLDAITTRLEINDANKRNYAMMIAKSVTNNGIKFTVEEDIVVEKLNKIDLDSKIDFNELNITDGLRNLSLSNKKETVLDSDDEDDDEDEEYEGEEEEQIPVFLKDLIVQYTKENIISVTKLLSHTVKLVRQKATFKLEIEFYSEELISVLIGLNNKFEEPGFGELKINAIVSVIVVNPAIISKVVELLFTGDYSLQQKLIILSSISLSARELRGLDDEFIDKPKTEFPTRQLPQRRPVQEIESTPKIEEIKDGDNEHIRSGTITRISRKLTSPKPESKPNNFAKIAPKFYYPLANAWIETGGLSMINQSEVFVKHYLQTLDLIIQAAYPCYGFEEMMELHQDIKANPQASIQMNI